MYTVRETEEQTSVHEIPVTKEICPDNTQSWVGKLSQDLPTQWKFICNAAHKHCLHISDKRYSGHPLTKCSAALLILSECCGLASKTKLAAARVCRMSCPVVVTSVEHDCRFSSQGSRSARKPSIHVNWMCYRANETGLSVNHSFGVESSSAVGKLSCRKTVKIV